MGSTPKRKKLNLQVEREFQMWLLIRILGIALVSSAVAASILYIYARGEMVDSFYTAHVKIRRVSDLLIPVVAAGSLVSLLGGALIALFLPQKIAGPIYRIERDLAPLREGDLRVAIRLRKNDTLQEFAGNLSAIIGGLRNRMGELKRNQEAIEQAFAAGDRDMAQKYLDHQKRLLQGFRTE